MNTADVTAALDACAPFLPGTTAPTPADLDGAAAALGPVLARLESEDPAAAEPASRFDPGQAFIHHPARAWPETCGTAAGGRVGPLERDLAAVALGSTAPEAPWLLYRAAAERSQALNAFITLCPAGHPQASCGQGPLRGAALAVKDIIETADLRTTGGSPLRADHVPPADAACWSRLRAAGACCVGKTNTQEFAAGSAGENDTYGPMRNPHQPQRVTGGSSGGSAAAVAAGLCAGALGSDTGGSIRIPAACCGVIGFKPTYGAVGCQGVFPLAWTLDHIGPIAASVRDAALMLAALWDPAVPPLPPPEDLGRPRPGGLTGLRVGVPTRWLDEAGADAAATGGLPTTPEVRDAFRRALAACEHLGAEVVPVDLGSADLITAINRGIALPESAAYHEADLRDRPMSFGQLIRPRLQSGRFVAATTYLRAQRLRQYWCERWAQVLTGPNGVHLVASPTCPRPAPPIGADPGEALSLLRFCAPFNVVGWPAVTLPCGSTTDGLPLAVQLAAAPWLDAALLAAAAALEAALPAPRRAPA